MFLTNQTTAHRSRIRILCAIKILQDYLSNFSIIHCPTAIGRIKFLPFICCVRTLAQYIMDHFDLTGSNFMENSIGEKMVNLI